MRNCSIRSKSGNDPRERGRYLRILPKGETSNQTNSRLVANHADLSMRKQMRGNEGHMPMVALKVNEQSAKIAEISV